MKSFALAGLIVLVLAGPVVCQEPEAADFPKPTKEHQWLNQLVGEWETEAEMTILPDQPPVKSKGTERTRSLGGFWVVSRSEGTVMDMPFTGIMTLGYDTEKQRYVGTWVDSANGYLWSYTGTLDPTGKKLTLETEGPCPMKAGEHAQFKEVIEIKSKDHKTFTSSMQDDDGQWQTFITVDARRKSK